MDGTRGQSYGCGPAIVSAGGVWPTGERSKVGSAIILEAEEDLERMTLPRLMAAGADLERIGIYKTVDLTQNLGFLEAEAERRPNLRLIVLSPLRKFFAKSEDHGNLGVRGALDPLLAWAERRGVCFLGIIHPLKGEEKKESFAGNPAFFEVARAAFSAIPDPMDKNVIIKLRRRVLVTAKNNLGDDSLMFRYRLEGAHADEIVTSRVVG